MVCVLIRRLLDSRDAARDALHVGVVLWTLMVGRFSDPLYPDLITGFALLLVVLVPVLSRRLSWLNRLQHAVSGGSDTWAGIVVYVFSYTCLTWLFPLFPGPSLGAMASLSLGDGLGGLVGRTWGHIRYQVPWSKPRSLEGSITVAVAAITGMAILKLILPVMAHVGWFAIVVSGILAAVTEAVSPKSLDNLFLPLVVFASIYLL